MDSTSKLLQTVRDRDDDKHQKCMHQQSKAVITAQEILPHYRQRSGWVPRNLKDCGDDGAFPEIPLDMRRQGNESTLNTLALQLDVEGKENYDVLARHHHSKDKIVYSKLSDLLPFEVEVGSENGQSLEKSSQGEIEDITEKTRQALMTLTFSNIVAPSQQGAAFNSGAKQKVVEAKVDPIGPQQLKINKMIPRGRPPLFRSVHTPIRRVIVKEKKQWKTPPRISNWKNTRRSCIDSLHKRLTAEDRDLQMIEKINARLAEILYIPDRGAAVETIAQLENEFAQTKAEQYPLDLRLKGNESTSNALAVQLDAEGKVKDDVSAGYDYSKQKIMYSKLPDLLSVEVEVGSENGQSLEKSSQGEIEDITEKTRQALMRFSFSKTTAAVPAKCADKLGPADHIGYTLSRQGAKQRVINVLEDQVDPIEPHVPVRHSQVRRVIAKEPKQCTIPLLISHWRNRVSLCKRVSPDVNIARSAEALCISDRRAQETDFSTAQLEKKVAQKEKEQKEEHLRQLSQKARDERADIKVGHPEDPNVTTKEEQVWRILLGAGERNLAHAAPDERTKQQERKRKRDISAVKNHFDERLFLKLQELGDREAFSIFDKPWREGGSLANQLYRPSRCIVKDNNSEDFEKIIRTNKFVPDKEFGRTYSTGAERSGPVHFDKEEDPLGLDQFHCQAKRICKWQSPEKRNDQDEKSENN